MALRPLVHVAPELLTKVNKVLGITALEQWYYVTQHAATEAIGVRVLDKYGGDIAGFLKFAYPHHNFDKEKLTSRVNHEKDQKFVEVIIRHLFPNEEIHSKARKAVGIINPETGAYLEIDIWIPSLKLGIEYQDKHHFGYQWYAHNALEDYQKRDDIKKSSMSSLGYTLITIGYWWDKTLDSVAAAIRKVRPDLLLAYKHVSAEPIPSGPPLASKTSPVIPGIAGIMNPFFPSSSFDPTNWYAGEKYDGIRGVFNPELNRMFSRSGSELSVLSIMLKDIPNMLVEGEIMAGRGNYSKTAALSYHAHHDKVNWPMFRYVLFDVPNPAVGNYTQRYATIIHGLNDSPFVFAQSPFRVLTVNKEHLKMLVDSILSDAGEGVIVQRDTHYEYGRAKGLAKIKVRRDAEAQVQRVRNRSCTCKLVSGLTVDIAFSDSFDSSSLNEGDIVSYYHDGHSHSGIPKRAEIYKVRYDIAWEDLIDKDQKVAKQRSAKEVRGSSSLMPSKVKNKMGFWNKSPNVRAFFDRFAQTAGFEPLVAENWYPVSINTVNSAGGGGLLKAYSFDRKKALSYAYPELKFTDNFKIHILKPRGFWNKPQNVRAFLDKFALSAGFDPLVSENWDEVKHSSVQLAKGSGLLRAYDYDLKKALVFAYPETKSTR